MGSYKCKTKCAADVGTVMGDDSCKDLGVRNFRYVAKVLLHVYVYIYAWILYIAFY